MARAGAHFSAPTAPEDEAGSAVEKSARRAFLSPGASGTARRFASPSRSTRRQRGRSHPGAGRHGLRPRRRCPVPRARQLSRTPPLAAQLREVIVPAPPRAPQADRVAGQPRQPAARARHRPQRLRVVPHAPGLAASDPRPVAEPVIAAARRIAPLAPNRVAAREADDRPGRLVDRDFSAEVSRLEDPLLDEFGPFNRLGGFWLRVRHKNAETAREPFELDFGAMPRLKPRALAALDPPFTLVPLIGLEPTPERHRRRVRERVDLGALPLERGEPSGFQ